MASIWDEIAAVHGCRGPLRANDELFAECNRVIFGLTPVHRDKADNEDNHSNAASAIELDDQDKVMYLLSSDEDDDDDDDGQEVVKTKRLRCPFVGCSVVLNSGHDLDAHQNCCHAHYCSTCHKCFPTDHLLDMHVAESHDVFFKVKAEREPSYRCLVEHCPLLFATTSERNNHAQRDHSYPSHFRFDPSPGLSPKKEVKKSNIAMEVEVSSSVAEAAAAGNKGSGFAGDDPHNNASNVENNNKYVPRVISFGHRKAPTFRYSQVYGGGKKKAGKQEKGTDVDMKDLGEALPEIK